MKLNRLKIVIVALIAIPLLGTYVVSTAFAEQSGNTPDSREDSILMETYNTLLGLGYGTETGSKDPVWNRIISSAVWTPSTATATVTKVFPGYTFYAGSDRTLRTGTAVVGKYNEQKYCRYDDWLNGAGTTGENTSEESVWTLTAQGGTPVSVTDNGITVSIVSNQVYKDNLTGLYWSNRTSAGVDNEFQWELGDDPVNPSSTSCNFLSPGTANSYCDNRDPTNAITEDNDVSAAEFCLNLELDADNADGDNNGATGVETDWYLPTQKQLLQAYIDGSANNLPNADGTLWSSSEGTNYRYFAFRVGLDSGIAAINSKAASIFVRCIRGTSN